jgi:hypothetical protein
MTSSIPSHHIIGIDIGTRNFAICILEIPSKEIKFWKVYDPEIRESDSKLQTCRKILEILRKLPVVRQVFVEAQPGKKRKMDYIEMVILTFFETSGIPVKSSQSRRKFPELLGIQCPKGKENYDLRKDLAVYYVQSWLSGRSKEFFSGQEKKDDLADCLCICLVEAQSL